MSQPTPSDPAHDARTREVSSAEAARGLLDEMVAGDAALAANSAAREAALPAAVLGTFAGFDGEGRALVDHPGNPDPEPLVARRTVALAGVAPGSEVVLAFESGDPRRPLVMGVVRAEDGRLRAEVDGEDLVLEAGRRIELRCGKARIVLHRDGRILIRGTHILSRSEGPNRVKGASIQLN